MLDSLGGIASGLSEGMPDVSAAGLVVVSSSTGAGVGFCLSVVGAGDGCCSLPLGSAEENKVTVDGWLLFLAPGSVVVGARVSWLTGRGVGTPVSLTGALVGESSTCKTGEKVSTGATVGSFSGALVTGLRVGERDDSSVGISVGVFVGVTDALSSSLTTGVTVGASVGTLVGLSVGASVGGEVEQQTSAWEACTSAHGMP